MEPIPPTPPSLPPDTSLTNSNRKQSAFFNPIKADFGGKQNLISPITVTGVDDGSGAVWKVIVIDIFAVFFAGVFSYSFARYLSGGFSFWFVLASLLLWGSASVLEGFLQKNSSHRFAVVFLEAIALVAFFYDYAWQALAITGVVMLVCLMWGYLSVRRELNNTLQIRFFNASGKMLGKVITAAVIFMIVMYASLSNDRGNFFVSQDGFNTFFNWTAQFVNNFYPTVPLTGSFGDFAQAVARMQLQGNPQFQSLTPAEQNAALASSAQQIITTFSPEVATSTATSTLGQTPAAPIVSIAPIATSTAGISSSTTAMTTTTPATATVSPAEPTSNAFYNYFASLFVQLQNKFGSSFIGVWGLLLFLALRSIAIIAVWIAQFVALVFYEFLLAVGFMKITEETASKETVGY